MKSCFVNLSYCKPAIVMLRKFVGFKSFFRRSKMGLSTEEVQVKGTNDLHIHIFGFLL